MKTKYEAIVILDEQHEDGGQAFAGTLGEAIAEVSGTNVERKGIGRRQLAFPIRKKTVGTYWQFFFECPPAGIRVLRERYRLDRSILRFDIFINDRPPASEMRRVTAGPASDRDND